MATSDAPRGTLPPGEPILLHTAVPYAPGAVVSRTLLKTDAGTLTLFAFDEGQGLSEHTAPFDALAQILEGTATLTIGGQPITARTGELVLMPAGVPHAVQATSRFTMLLTMFKSERK
jgi:quercetin dioxygenase-like cupin family protein